MKTYPVSFIIPVYNSEQTIEKVIDSIIAIKDFDSQIILINDNSPDNVDYIIKNIISKYQDKIIYLKHHINCGQQASLINGFHYAHKQYVATIDDDGQNSPSEVLKILKFLVTNELDIVYGRMDDRKQSLFRRLLSKSNILLSKYTIGNKLLIPFSNVRVMNIVLARAMSSSSSQHSYIEGLVFSLTSKIGYLDITHSYRLSGKSNYNFISLLKLLLNHIIGYSNIVLKALSLTSFMLSILAFSSGAIYFVLTIGNAERPSGWLSLYLITSFLFSMLFLILGFLTEYISRVYSSINFPQRTIIEEAYYSNNKIKQ